MNAAEWAVIPPAHVSHVGFIQYVKAYWEVTGDLLINALT